MVSKECIAMLLAGGPGSRLGVLTKNLAKPAVPFGGKYRIIDFTLSNCINSGIDTVGVLTQYQPMELNAYIGNGQPWDLDRNNGGVSILPPYVKVGGGQWYKGTANAVYQNINFVDGYGSRYVLFLSGDHIYKMDYSLMLKRHKEKQADCTIAVIGVPEREAHRFGILNADEDGRISEFEEKPENPKSNKASMGVYIFTWEKLKQYLQEDEEDMDSSNDFGKNIIPRMLLAGERMFVYEFSGYWRDVGTIESFFEANMDLLSADGGLNLYDPAWRIYGKNPVQPPQYIAREAKVANSMLAEGASIYGEVENSVVFYGARIYKGASVSRSIIMPNTVIGEGSRINNAIIAENTVIGKDARIGEAAGRPGITVVGGNLSIADGAEIPSGAMIGKNL